MDNQTFHWTDCLDMIKLTIDMRVIKKKYKFKEPKMQKKMIRGYDGKEQ